MLVILGLLVGGVLAGKSLIRSAEMKVIHTEYNHYRTAIGAFRQKYFYYPGDMPNATQFWGAEADCTGYVWDATPKKLTCNGNGDGKVYHIAKPNASGVVDGASMVANYPESQEVFRAWQQLANSGLITGQYVGRTVSDPGTSFPLVASVGLNIPQSKFSKAGWAFAYYQGMPIAFYNPPYQHVLEFGAQSTDVSMNWNGGVLTPEEAFAFDRKFDDGTPNKGYITTRKSVGIANCTTTMTSIYNLAKKTKACGLIFDVR